MVFHKNPLYYFQVYIFHSMPILNGMRCVLVICSAVIIVTELMLSIQLGTAEGYCTPNLLLLIPLLHAHQLMHTSPKSKYTSDHSWPKPKWTDPIYAIKTPYKGFPKGATSCLIYMALSSKLV